METLDNHEAMKRLAMAIDRWIVLIHFENWNNVPNYYEELRKAAPYLNFDKDLQAIADGSAAIICEDEDECEQIFRQTVGDDGPTKTNSYDGPVRVYALTIGPDGQFYNENT